MLGLYLSITSSLPHYPWLSWESSIRFELFFILKARFVSCKDNEITFVVFKVSGEANATFCSGAGCTKGE